jgi:hypothetical protein
MKYFGRTTVSEFLDDRVVYRNLAPVDQRLPTLRELRAEIGLEEGYIPRKSEADYARVIVALLRHAQALQAPGVEIAHLIFIGDTRLNDGTAFANICQAGGWPGLAFIGSETAEPASVKIEQAPGGRPIYLANRWAALVDSGGNSFVDFCARQGFAIDAATAVVIDLDKTTLGARGRNAQVIDQARVQAVRDTVAGLLGSTFDAGAFQAIYDRLNQVAYHPFTTDNQDYLAYICLVLGSGLFDPQSFFDDVQNGRLKTFRQFIAQVEAQIQSLGPELAQIHREIYANVRAGDPTPFKTFRRNEYLTTTGRMGNLSDNTPVEMLLANEIVITQEVRTLALDWKQRGALLFGLSDKPDEASFPTTDQAAGGHRPIHRTETHAIGDL